MMAVEQPTVAVKTTPERIRHDIEPVLESLRGSAAQREAQREHPSREIRQLAEAGLLRYRVPQEEGGAGATLRELAELVTDIATADSNVAQALRPGFLVADGLATGNLRGASREQILRRVLSGDLFSGTRNEASGKPGGVATRVVKRGDTLRVNGKKYYSTGGLHAQWFSGNAIDEYGNHVNFTVPTQRAGVELRDDFDAVGQRLTASGTTVLNDVELDPEDLTAFEEQRRHPAGSLPHLILAATLAGIAQAAHEDAVRVVRTVTRPIKHSSAERSEEDPYVRLAVGDIATRAFAARAVVVSAAETLDAHWSDPHDSSGPEATVAVAHAYVHAGEQALRAGETLFDVGGGRLTSRELNLDRHWRNARTVVNHNPRSWKNAAAGAWSLAGEEPPTNGLF